MNERELQIRVEILQVVVAYLLARESKLSNHDMTTIHDGLSDAVSRALSAKQLTDLETAGGELFLDSIYSLASVFAEPMQR